MPRHPGTLTRRLGREYRFEAAHVLECAHASPACMNLHGHSYKVEVEVEFPQLNDEDMLLDFHTLDEIVKPIIESFDHAVTITQAQLHLMQPGNMLHTQKVTLLATEELAQNATAERIAEHICRAVVASPVLLGALPATSSHNKDICVAIRVWETARSWAQCSIRF